MTHASRRCRATLGAVVTAIAAIAVVPRGDLQAQADTSRARGPRTAPRREGGNHELTIPFTIGPVPCVDAARSYVVTMRIHNVLAQPVGIPVLISGSSLEGSQAALARRPVSNLRLTCGRYAAQWDGRHVTTGRRLAPGTYLSELVIDGQRVTRKVMLGR